MLFSIGKIRYSPKLAGNTSEKWWVVVDCQKDIGNYYRYLYSHYFYKCKTIQRPAWDEHISVVRNEEPPNKNLWNKYEGCEIQFTYQPNIETDGSYYWLPVECDFLLDLRVELGLSREPEFPLHLTIGNNVNI